MVYINTEESETANANMISYDNSSKFLHTKLLIPKYPADCLNRGHLHEKLNELRGKKLTLLTAPAGYGKTTLVSKWVEKHGEEIKPCWVALDENDNNEFFFWYYVAMSFSKAITEYMDEDISVYAALPAASITIMQNELINKLSGVQGDIVLVVDDYHLIHNESIHESMQYFINHMSENVHIVMISRILPPLKFARLRGHGYLLELTSEDFKLTSDEISEFLDETMKLYLDESGIKKLGEYTEGWIAALNLIVISVKKGFNLKEHPSCFNPLNEYLIEYMSEEVFNLLNADVKVFLLKTSILDSLNVSLCNEVVGINNSKEILSRLEKDNIFINALDDRKNSYRYHSLFAEFLRNRLMRTSINSADLLYLKASNWYERKSMIQDALEYSEKSNNHQNTARLIEKYGEILIINKDFLRIRNLLEALPEKLIAGSAGLCALYILTFCFMNGDGGENIQIGSITVSLDGEIFHGAELELLLVKMMRSWYKQDYQAALEYGEQAIGSMSNESLLQCIPYKILCRIYCIAGNSKKAEELLNLYVNSLRNRGCFDELFIGATYAHMMVQIFCSVGNFKNALDFARSFEANMSADNLPVHSIANSIYLDLGFLYYEYGELELSYKNINKCMESCSEKTDVFGLAKGYVINARLLQSEGKYDDAMEYIHKAEELCDRYNLRPMLLKLLVYIVRILLSIGRIEFVEHIINKYDIRIQDDLDLAHEGVHLALADFYAAKGEYDRSEGILNKLYEKTIKSERNLTFTRTMILKALAAKGKGNGTESMTYMKAAIEGASEQGYIKTFTDFGIPAAEIICSLLKQKEEAALTREKDICYANCLLLHIKEPQKRAFKAELELIKRLSKRELEVLKYLRNGLTNKEIASGLYIEECTVKKHINSIYSKIGAVNRDQAIQICEKLNQ